MAPVVSNSIPFDRFLDAEGQPCPLPLLKTRLQLKSMAPGEVLLVKASDAGSWRDIPRFVEVSPHRLLASQEDGKLYSFWIEKGSA